MIVQFCAWSVLTAQFTINLDTSSYKIFRLRARVFRIIKIRCIRVEEAKDVCLDRSRWPTLVFICKLTIQRKPQGAYNRSLSEAYSSRLLKAETTILHTIHVSNTKRLKTHHINVIIIFIETRASVASIAEIAYKMKTHLK